MSCTVIGRPASEPLLAWMDSKRAPAHAFVWVASHQAKRQDYTGAIETLESGRQRMGASTPFLPTLVAMARYAGNLPLARDYASECKAESNRELGERLQSIVAQDSTPKGLYAECVRALGEKPAGDVVTEAVSNKAFDLGKQFLKKR